MSHTSPELSYRVAARVAVLAGAFSAIVAALLAYEFTRRDAKHPAEEAAYLAVKAAMAQAPENEELKVQFRDLDAHLREAYFRQRAFAAVGGGMLLAGLAVFLIAAKTATVLRRKLPEPGPMPPPRDVDAELSRVARWAVAGLLIVLLGGVAGLTLAYKTNLPVTEAELTSSVGEQPTPVPPPKPKTPEGSGESPQPMPAIAPDHPTPDPSPAAPQPGAGKEAPPADEEVRRAWPRFRGPDGLGISAYTNIPTKWDATSGENIVWKTAVPLPGNNSPVVWGKRVFLSGADEKRREVYCFDADKGSLLWKQEAPGTPQSTAKVPKVNDDTGFAAPTTATDGRRVYAIFANGDLAAFTVDGKLSWSKSLGMPDNSYGHASSLAMYQGLLLVQMDQGNIREPRSKLMAFKAATGEPAWEVKREVPNSWTTPIVIHAAGRDQLITAADPWTIAYDPHDGKEIWRAKTLRQDIGPSPTFADGVVYTANEFPALTAIRADGQGDVTKTHVLWRGEDNLPDTCSPLATKDAVYVVTTAGTLTCYDAKSGEIRWEKEFDDTNFNASPSLVGNQIYLVGTEGKCWVVEPAADGCKDVAEADLGEKCVTSPAFQDGRLYLRGNAHLFCIGK